VKLLRRADELMRRYLAGAGTVGLLKIVKGLKMTNRDVALILFLKFLCTVKQHTRHSESLRNRCDDVNQF
jgi:hypothetical protein